MTTPVEPAENSGQDTPPVNEPNINPAWNDVLNVIPESLHSQITPHLQKWDEGVQTRINETQSRYSGWDPFVQNNVSPEIAAAALQLAESIQRDPRRFYDEMGAHYKFTPAQQKAIEDAVEDGEEIPNPTNDPRIDELNNKVQLMARILVEEKQKQTKAQQDAEEDRVLDEALNGLKAKLGDRYNEQQILQLMNGFDDPAKAWEFVESMTQPKALEGRVMPAPRVMGSGGQIPITGNKHPSLMTNDETETLIAEMLTISNRERRK